MNWVKNGGKKEYLETDSNWKQMTVSISFIKITKI